MSVAPEYPVNFYEGLFISEGHFVQFTLIFDNKVWKVWVDEAIESNHKPQSKIITKIYGISDAMKFQSSLINFGYNHLPACELNEEPPPQYIN
jgi:hypothetical protein